MLSSRLQCATSREQIYCQNESLSHEDCYLYLQMAQACHLSAKNHTAIMKQNQLKLIWIPAVNFSQ